MPTPAPPIRDASRSSDARPREALSDANRSLAQPRARQPSESAWLEHVRPRKIVVVPDCVCRYGCGQWVDSPVTGNFEQYVLHDVIPHVDSAYRTIADASSRSVFGFSSDGFGSWNLASRHPDVFGAMAVLSAGSWLDMTHKFILYKYLDSIWPDAPDGPIEGNVWAEIVYNYSATYSPNPDNPPYYVDLPVAFPSGELLHDVWDRWLSFDPVVNVHDRLGNLRTLRGILLDVGSNDDYELQWGHRLLSHYLTQAGIATSTGRTQAITADAPTSATRSPSSGSRRRSNTPEAASDWN